MQPTPEPNLVRGLTIRQWSRRAGSVARPARPGGRLRQRPGAERGLPIASGLELHSQRRADPARFGAHHGWSRILLHTTLDVVGEIRRRVRARLANLCWLGDAALCLVTARR